MFSVVTGLLFYKVFSWWISKSERDLRRFVIVSFVYALLMSYVAQQFFGVADITGAYLAGLIISMTKEKEYVRRQFDTISYMLFTPVFFASIGIKITGLSLTVHMAFILTGCQSEKTEEAPKDIEVEVITSETVPETTSEAPLQEETTVDGIVTDATMTAFTIQNQDGEFLFISLPEDGIYDNQLSDGLVLGKIVEVTFSGSSENGDATVTALKDSTIKAPLSEEEYQFILSAIQAVKFLDMDTLSTMMSYPVYVDLGDSDAIIESKDDFLKLDKTTLLNEDLVTTIADFTLFNVSESNAGIVIGDGKPNVIIGKTADGQLAVTGINAAK